MGNVCIDDAETHECQVIIGPERTIISEHCQESVFNCCIREAACSYSTSLYKRFNQHIVSDSKHLQKQQLAFPIMSRCHSCSLGTEPLPVSTGVWHGAVCIHLGTLGYGCNMSQHLL